MNIVYIVGIVMAFFFTVFGIVVGFDMSTLQFSFSIENLKNFVDLSSILIVIGGTLAVVVACYPKQIRSLPKHFKIMLHSNTFDPQVYVDQLTELAQIARKNGLLALEEKGNEQENSFFKQAIMLVVDNNDPERVRSILENEIEQTSERHQAVIAMYERGSNAAPAFGMIGTLIGLINMLKNLDGADMNSLGPDMAVALITTFYGSLLAHVVFNPIAANLTARDEEEILCRQIIMEGIMAIQSGENPKFLRERLLTFMNEKQRKKKSGSGGANWMDTYGDMVTLLLCFFVMLFSMSKMDESKWIALVQALNPSAVVNGTSMEEPPEGSVVTQDQVDRDMEQLYQAMAEYFQQENMMEKVSIGKGNGYVFISFNDTVFFRPNEYTLLDEGKEVLDQVARSIAVVGPSINEIRVLGHTAQATANEENDYTVDRFLASNRATVVTVYLQEKEIIDPARLVSVGYGQWRPISSNAIPEERAKNRRVELIVTGLDLDALAGDDIKQYYSMRESTGTPSPAYQPEEQNAAS